MTGTVFHEQWLARYPLIIAEDVVNLRIDGEDTVGIYIENIMFSSGLKAFDKRTL
jgi:hypothetical protein